MTMINSTRQLTHRSYLLAVLALLLAAGPVLADGMIVPVRPDLPVQGSWAVKYHHVDIRVRNQVAKVSIEQEFVNTGTGMIEVEYLFPVPPDAAIDSMTLMVNGKEFTAKLLKADEARKIYEEIVRQKKDPALLEYAGFGLYRTRAFPLEPGTPAKVLVTYQVVCNKDQSLVEVWYPLNTEKFSAKPVEDVRVRVDVEANADIATVYSPSHQIQVARQGSRKFVATYQAENITPTTDLQVFYALSDADVGATLMTYESAPDSDGYFLLLVSPNPASAATTVVPKDIVLVLDRSGSMGGKKIRQAREAAKFVLSQLNKGDRFNVVVYSDSVMMMFDQLQPANDMIVKEAIARIDQIDASGGTNIHEALEVAMGAFTSSSDSLKRLTPRPKYVLFLTDGIPTIGNTNETEIIANTTKSNPGGARVFAFGVGYDVNVRLLDRIVEDNGGRSSYVKETEPIESKVSSLYAKIKNPIMTNLTMSLRGVGVRDMYPRELGDLFEGDQIVVAGRYDAASIRKLPAIKKGVYLTTLLIKGQYAGKEKAFEYPVMIVPDSKAYPFAETLWAVQRIGYLLDQIQLHGESGEVVEELVKLSLKYGIITPYTSFLADETTNLASPEDVADMAEEAAEGLAADVSGGAGQRNADNRRATKEAQTTSSIKGDSGGAKMVGNTNMGDYEAENDEEVATVRQYGNQAIYRRGQTWVAANAASVDLEKDKDQLVIIERLSDAYFQLVTDNTTEENQILASQKTGELLVVNLRGQVYLIR
jgi:Ca-activated chloride channel homolog